MEYFTDLVFSIKGLVSFIIALFIILIFTLVSGINKKNFYMNMPLHELEGCIRSEINRYDNEMYFISADAEQGDLPLLQSIYKERTGDYYPEY